jgi:DNA-binding winged helix-turn-helix (wHTH) protein
MESIVAPGQGTAAVRMLGELSPVEPRHSGPLVLADSSQDVVILDLGSLNLSMRELVAWLRAGQQRGAAGEVPRKIMIGNMQIDLAAKAVTNRDGRGVRLTPTEWQLLEQLLRRPGEVVSRGTLLTALRGRTDYVDRSYLRVYMAHLRQKLEPEPREPRFLITEPGLGYKFQPSVRPTATQPATWTPSGRSHREIQRREYSGAGRRRCRPGPKR